MKKLYCLIFSVGILFIFSGIVFAADVKVEKSGVKPGTVKVPLNITIDSNIVYNVTTLRDGTKKFGFHATVTSTTDLVHVYVKFKYGFAGQHKEETNAVYSLKAHKGKEIYFYLVVPPNTPFKGRMYADPHNEWKETNEGDNTTSTLEVFSLL